MKYIFTKVLINSFARVLIEMDVARELPKKLKVEDPNGRMFEQAVHYEWAPEYCDKCLQVGHKCHGKEGIRPPRKQAKWVQKEVVNKNGTKEIQGTNEGAV